MDWVAHVLTVVGAVGTVLGVMIPLILGLHKARRDAWTTTQAEIGNLKTDVRSEFTDMKKDISLLAEQLRISQEQHHKEYVRNEVFLAAIGRLDETLNRLTDHLIGAPKGLQHHDPHRRG